jgi:hypothetical protein
LYPGGDIAVDAAASLAGIRPAQAVTLLTELARAHLLTQHVPGRYTFHGLLRAYAAELADTSQPPVARQGAPARVLDQRVAPR